MTRHKRLEPEKLLGRLPRRLLPAALVASVCLTLGVGVPAVYWLFTEGGWSQPSDADVRQVSGVLLPGNWRIRPSLIEDDSNSVIFWVVPTAGPSAAAGPVLEQQVAAHYCANGWNLKRSPDGLRAVRRLARGLDVYDCTVTVNRDPRTGAVQVAVCRDSVTFGKSDWAEWRFWPRVRKEYALGAW